MRVTICQINTTGGDYAGNTAKIVRAIERARRDGSDLVVFPEITIQGYTSFDWFLDRDVVRNCLAPLDEITRATKGIAAIVGTVRPADVETGRRLYNSAAVISDGELLGFADKTLLPAYDIFDEPRYFEPSRVRRLFSLGDARLGVAVCEDFWNDRSFWKERLYAHDPTEELIEMGASLLVSINASPFGKGKIKERRAMVSHRARATGLPIVFVNLVGGNDGVIFDGASMVADSRGQIILQAPPFEEFTGTVDLDCGLRDERRLPDHDTEAIHRALVLGVGDYARKNNFTTAVLGLSGKIDSAVTAALACEALGAENVLGVMIPSLSSSRAGKEDSVELGRRLGMKIIEHPITTAFEVLTKQLGLVEPTGDSSSMAANNLQSRLRSNILMAVSNSENRLLLSTINKSELALGSFTLYGDTCGALAVLGDVLQSEVYGLAQHLNRESEIIPRAIVEKHHSAELAPGEFNAQSLLSYERIDPILRLYFEQQATPAEIIGAGHDAALVYKLLNRVESPANELKRRQLPPALVITRNAIGIGRRRPVTHRYRRPMSQQEGSKDY